jgi:DNA (cytosine-5)-methyltransferase 1
LVQEYWRIVRESNADAFVFENVPSILHPRNKKTLDGLMQSARDCGYLLRLLMENAAEFGVPQRRVRVFLLGLKHAEPPEPRRTHVLEGEGHTKGFAPVTAGEALEPFSGKEYFEPEEVVNGRWAQHLKTVPPGMNYKAHTKWAGHPRPTFVTETRFWNFLLKLSPARPSWTIAASPGPWTGPFHWKSRRLRTPEFAALQGFPKNYSFEGSRRDRIRQIGNAVPPPLAKAMIQPLVKIMSGKRVASRS